MSQLQKVCATDTSALRKMQGTTGHVWLNRDRAENLKSRLAAGRGQWDLKEKQRNLCRTCEHGTEG